MNTRRRLIAGILFSLTGLVSCGWAATYTVTTYMQPPYNYPAVAALQYAVDQAAANPGPDEVYIPTGTYVLDDTDPADANTTLVSVSIGPGNPLTLYGDGAADNATVLFARRAKAGGGVETKNIWTFVLDNASDVTIRHIKFRGAGSCGGSYGTGAIKLVCSRNVAISDIVTHDDGCGVYFAPSAAGPNQCVSVRRCEMKGANTSAPGIYMESATDCLIENCNIHGLSTNGIKLATGPIERNIFRGNLVYRNAADGLDLCLLSSPLAPGPAWGNRFEANIFAHNGLLGLGLKKGAVTAATALCGNIVARNIMMHNGYAGIEIAKCAPITTFPPPCPSGSDFTVVTENVVEHNGRAGDGTYEGPGGISILNNYGITVHRNWSTFNYTTSTTLGNDIGLHAVGALNRFVTVKSNCITAVTSQYLTIAPGTVIFGLGSADPWEYLANALNDNVGVEDRPELREELVNVILNQIGELATGDWDHDGLSNAEELMNDTDPNDPTPAPPAPQITGWQIGATHEGGVGEVWSAVSDGYLEPRTAGLRMLRAGFDQAMDTSMTKAGAVAVVGADQGDQSGLVDHIAWDNATQVSVYLSAAVPDQDTYTITLSPSFRSAAGQPLDGDRDIVLRTLVGDVSGDGDVDNGDLIIVRNHRDEPVTAANARYDVNVSGEINNGDMIVVRNHRGRAVAGPGLGQSSLGKAPARAAEDTPMGRLAALGGEGQSPTERS